MPEFNMPPGVSVNDIPGNRPEDLAEEAWWEKLGELCPDVPQSIWDDEVVQKLVESARDLAYSTGYDEGRADAALAAVESASAEPQPQECDHQWRPWEGIACGECGTPCPPDVLARFRELLL